MTTPSLPGDERPEGALPLNSVIAGRYRIDRKLGEGGMAVVYVAHDLTRDVPVAIKAPKGELVSQLGPNRFAREVQIATQLQHPHIVPVLDSGVHEGVTFYVMPLIEGQSLEQRLRRSGPLAIADAVALISEVLDGLAYAHSLGFVHRDVKPANVLLTRGHAQLADFGIARVMEFSEARRLTESGFALGTAEYMSPEQASGEKDVDGRSDIYSVGCVLYEMLVGSPPFNGSTSRAIMARHFVDPVPAIRTVRDTVPEALESIVFTAMAKTPADRFQSAEAFLEALREPEVRATLTNPAHRSSSNALPLSRVKQAQGASSSTRRVLVGAAVAAAAALGLFAWRAKTAAAEPLDPNRVMVFPFEQSAELASRASLGEDVATIIGNALDAAEPLHWIDGWSSLDAAERADLRGITDENARTLARRKRCAFVVRGRLTKVSNAIEVSLALYDVAGDSIISRGSARGAVDEPWKQGLDAVNKVLPRLIAGAGAGRNLVGEWQGRPPAAVANFLIGEAKFRRVQMQSAFEAYRTAVGLDSTFAIAALRGAQAASWGHNLGTAASLVRVALSQTLPPHRRDFALGLQAYLAGAADSAIVLLTRATAADPENVAAWSQLGEVYVHLLPTSVATSTDAAAESAFQHARALDSTAVNLLYHPIQIRLRRGDTADAFAMFARFRDAKPDQTSLEEAEIATACLRTNANADTLRAALLRAPLEFLSGSAQLVAGLAHPRCGRVMFDMVQAIDTAATDSADGRRYVSLAGTMILASLHGDSATAHTAVTQFEQRWPAVPGLLLTAATWFPSFAARAHDVAKADSVRHGVALGTIAETKTIFRTALYEITRGNITRAALLQNTIKARAAMRDSVVPGWYLEAIEGHVLLARGDTTAAEAMLRKVVGASAESGDGQWDITATRGMQRLSLAQVLLARGQPRAAWDVANVFDSPASLVYVAYLPASLALRAEAAKQLGDVASERTYRKRLATVAQAP